MSTETFIRMMPLNSANELRMKSVLSVNEMPGVGEGYQQPSIAARRGIISRGIRLGGVDKAVTVNGRGDVLLTEN